MKKYNFKLEKVESDSNDEPKRGHYKITDNRGRTLYQSANSMNITDVEKEFELFKEWYSKRYTFTNFVDSWSAWLSRAEMDGTVPPENEYILLANEWFETLPVNLKALVRILVLSSRQQAYQRIRENENGN